jgi:hypothetical protein
MMGMNKCISGKRVFISKEIAEEALIEAHIRYSYKDGTGPMSVYQCEDCGQYHLTSNGPMNPRLAELFKDGKIQTEKEAHQWMKQIKNKGR